MQIFSRFCVFMFLCVILLHAGGTVDVHAQSLEMSGDTGVDKVYQVGDTVRVEFIAADENHDPAAGVTLTITSSGLTGVPNGVTTDVLGTVTVTGTIIADTDVYIQAEWPRAGLTIRRALTVMRDVAKHTAQAVFHRHSTTFQHPDVHEHFPDVLRAFKNPEMQSGLNSAVIHHFVRDPKIIRRVYPATDDSILVLLLLDDKFQALFQDEQFHAVVRSSNEIDKLMQLIRQTTPLPRDPTCPPPQPELPRATRLSIVSGSNQSGEVGKLLAQPFVVGVLDQEGKPLQGAAVTFTVTAGNGRLFGQVERTIVTDVYGQARTTLTLGSGASRHLVMARAVGITQRQMFTATAVAAPPSKNLEPVVPVLSSTSESLLPPMYWIEGNTIYYRPTGGEKEIFNAPQNGTLTGGLAVDTVRRKIYWTEEILNNRGRIQMSDLDGTGVQWVKEIQAVPFNIAVGTDKSGKRWVYWTTSGKKIQRINVDGSGFQGDFMILPTLPKHIAFDEREDRLYWTEMGRIRGVAANGKGKRETIVEDLGELGGIAVFDDVIYWTEQTDGLGSVRSMHRSGAGVKLLAVTESIPAGIAVDPIGGRVYWTTADGEIQSVSLTGAIRTDVTSEMLGAGPAAGIALGGTAGGAAAPAAPSISPVVSAENTLLANYPNPFNPETWIPYQLSNPAEVTLHIYAVNGALIRTLALGYQPAGMYQNKSRAAYWDGRNEIGESVSSGIYFYTLTAGDFTATRKLLIRK